MSYEKSGPPSAPPLDLGPHSGPPPPYSGPGYPSLPNSDNINVDYPQMPQPQLQQQQQPATMIINTGLSGPPASSANYGPFPIFVTCPGCNQPINTKTTSSVGLITWLSSILCCVFCCWPCACCPFCMDCTQNVNHHCPNCKRRLGQFRRL